MLLSVGSFLRQICRTTYLSEAVHRERLCSREKGLCSHCDVGYRGAGRIALNVYIGVLHICQKTTVIQNTHPVIDAMIAVVIHLISAAAMLHEGLCDDVRGGGFVYGHSRDLGTTWFIASHKLGKRTFCSINFKLISCSHHLE